MTGCPTKTQQLPFNSTSQNNSVGTQHSAGRIRNITDSKYYIPVLLLQKIGVGTQKIGAGTKLRSLIKKKFNTEVMMHVTTSKMLKQLNF